MTVTASLEDLTLNIIQEIRVGASLETTFAALLEQLGPHNETPEGNALPMVLEPWPGGRWFRDLGNGNGHFWATVQAIKKPTLLEFAGPLMMSHPVANNVQYRLSEDSGGTLIKFRHSGFGLVLPEHKTGVRTGWTYIHECVRKRAESGRAKSAVQ
jgi:hypothetical protein